MAHGSNATGRSTYESTRTPDGDMGKAPTMRGELKKPNQLLKPEA